MQSRCPLPFTAHLVNRKQAVAVCVCTCDAFLLRVCVAFLLDLTELAKPVEMPCLCFSRLGQLIEFEQESNTDSHGARRKAQAAQLCRSAAASSSR